MSTYQKHWKIWIEVQEIDLDENGEPRDGDLDDGCGHCDPESVALFDDELEMERFMEWVRQGRMMIITLKYKGTCNHCETPLPKGTQAHWRRRHGVTCLVCRPTKESIARAQMARDQQAWNETMADHALQWRTCPDCGTENALSAHEARKGYHCKSCTAALEFGAV